MYTVTDIIEDVRKGCLVNNIVESRVIYRITFYINEGHSGRKYYVNSSYRDLRKSLENIIRDNLTLTNNIVIAGTSALKNGKCVHLQSKSYAFSLEEYFRRVKGEYRSSRNNTYGRYAV